MKTAIEKLGTVTLSYAFAMALNIETRWNHMTGPEVFNKGEWIPFNPAENIEQLAPYIEVRGIEVSPIRFDSNNRQWQAQCWKPYGVGQGGTPQLAACRAVVNATYGDAYEVPIFPQ